MPHAECLLNNCRNAMDNNGRVLVFDHAVRPPNESCPGKVLDLTRRPMLPGRERNADEFAAMFARAGLRLAKITPILGSFSVLEGVMRPD
ncbi:MAG TPA: methyltransferase [Gammaproteobacteria bacterium]